MFFISLVFKNVSSLKSNARPCKLWMQMIVTFLPRRSKQHTGNTHEAFCANTRKAGYLEGKANDRNNDAGTFCRSPGG